MQSKNPNYIYGPVPSRRLGFSLGIDLVPYKTCSYDCIYCQLGRTTHKTTERKEYLPKDDILLQLERKLSTLGGLNQRIDYITFSGSGEPTLNSTIGYLIRKFKQMTDIPVAVLTNGSLLYDKDVVRDLMSADLILPSLDGVRATTFERINRPHPSLDIQKIINGLKNLRMQFKGTLWLEVMLVKDLNDTPADISSIKNIVSEIAPDKVHLNTVARPPAEVNVQPLTINELNNIRNLFPGNCEIIAEFKERQPITYVNNIESDIIELIRRRPVTLTDISISLGIHRDEVIKWLEILRRRDLIKAHNLKGSVYYKPK